MYQSEIRPSQINDLLEKVRQRKYGQYLLSVIIDKARSIEGKRVDFNFPVTAVVGPNGGGKTTIAGAAAILYKDIAPADFFAKSGKYDSSMLNWRIEYEVIDRSVKANDTVRRTAKYHNAKWVRNSLQREVIVFGVSRTVPAAERKELRRCVSNKFYVEDDKIEALSTTVASSVSSILDKDVSQFKHMRVDQKGYVTLLAGVDFNGDSYSEFHFGAGESSVIRMVSQLESASENSLVIVEEIENGLHPVATMRMVEYLVELAERKKIQAIFTTHSNDALIPLPNAAIWASVNGELYNGKLDIRSLRAITGQVNSRLVIFVEDDFAEKWVFHLLSAMDGVAIDAISIHPMNGDGVAVRVHKHHELDPSAKQPSICIIDGDSEQVASDDAGIYRLPGSDPESTVFDCLLMNIDAISGELAVALLKPYEFESKLEAIMSSVRNTTREPHLLFSQLGKKIGLIPEERVKDACISIWCRMNPDVVARLEEKLGDVLPKETDSVEEKTG